MANHTGMARNSPNTASTAATAHKVRMTLIVLLLKPVGTRFPILRSLPRYSHLLLGRLCLTIFPYTQIPQTPLAAAAASACRSRTEARQETRPTARSTSSTTPTTQASTRKSWKQKTTSQTVCADTPRATDTSQAEAEALLPQVPTPSAVLRQQVEDHRLSAIPTQIQVPVRALHHHATNTAVPCPPAAACHQDEGDAHHLQAGTLDEDHRPADAAADHHHRVGIRDAGLHPVRAEVVLLRQAHAIPAALHLECRMAAHQADRASAVPTTDRERAHAALLAPHRKIPIAFLHARAQPPVAVPPSATPPCRPAAHLVPQTPQAVRHPVRLAVNPSLSVLARLTVRAQAVAAMIGLYQCGSTTSNPPRPPR